MRHYTKPEVKERVKENHNRWIEIPGNQERQKGYWRKWSEKPENIDNEKKRRKKWRESGERKEYNKQYHARAEVKKRRNERHKERYDTDILYRLKCDLRCIISNSIKRQGYTKCAKTIKILGADFETVQKHLGPTPEHEHHIDHICPVAQAQNEEEALKLCHYTNLRYLPSEENLRKSDSKTPEGEEMCRKLLDREWIE